MYELTTFSVMGDQRGSLVSLECGSQVPFDIKRVYYLYGTKENATRGFHAHRELKQLIVAVNGSCDFSLDDGTHHKTLTLNSPNIGLYLRGKIWREMSNFSHDCVLMVLASEIYSEEDYIRDYDVFVHEVRNDPSVI